MTLPFCSILLQNIGRIVGYTPGITHVFHKDELKNNGLPYYVVHASLETVLEYLEKVKPEDKTVMIPQTPVDYQWERKHRFKR